MKNKIKIAIFWLARALGLFALCRNITASQVRILCYHGGCLKDESSFNPKLFCSPETLARRMDWLKRKRFNLVTLDAAASLVAAPPGSRAPLSTAITFDDGWYSTASQLLPVLGARGIPSTLYLCTSHFLEGWAIPSVSVRYLIWKSGRDTVQLSGFGAGVDGAHDLSTPAARNAAANRIVAAIDASPAVREGKHALLEQLAQCLQVPSQDLALATRRFEYLNQAELQELARHGCTVELHGHVHNYPAGDTAAFKRDMQQCSAAIMAAGMPRPTHYCYPSGNFDGAASAALQELGVVTATTCLPGLITRASATESHYLPRFLDGESVDMLDFEAEMSGFSDLIRRLVRKPHPLQPA